MPASKLQDPSAPSSTESRCTDCGRLFVGLSREAAEQQACAHLDEATSAERNEARAVSEQRTQAALARAFIAFRGALGQCPSCAGALLDKRVAELRGGEHAAA